MTEIWRFNVKGVTWKSQPGIRGVRGREPDTEGTKTGKVEQVGVPVAMPQVAVSTVAN